MASAGHFHRVRGARAPAPGARGPVVRACRFADRVGQCFEVVAAGVRGCGAVGEPHHFPAPWRGKPLTVFGTEVVAVGLGVGGERAEDRGRIGIDVRQCRDGGAAARSARTATYRAHDVGRYRTLERAATTVRRVTPPCRPVTCGTAVLSVAPLTCAGRGPGDRTVVEPVAGEGGSRRRARGQRSDYGPEKGSVLAEIFNGGRPEAGTASASASASASSERGRSSRHGGAPAVRPADAPAARARAVYLPALPVTHARPRAVHLPPCPRLPGRPRRLTDRPRPRSVTLRR